MARMLLVVILLIALLILPLFGYAQGVEPGSQQRTAVSSPSPGTYATVRTKPPVATPGALIRLRVGSFTPTAGEELVLPDYLTADHTAGGWDYYIVQFQGPIYEEWKGHVASLGGMMLDYVPDFAFVVYMDDATRADVAKLAEVVWIGPFHPAYKLSPDLAEVQGPLDLMVQTFPTEPVETAAGELAGLGAQVQDSSQQPIGGLLRLTIDASQLTALAHIPAVRWIEPFYERVLFNDVSRSSMIMDAETLWSTQGLYGAGQVVAVSDTGLDTGSLSTIHQDFQGNPTGCSGTDRILATYALGRTSDWSDSCRSGVTNYGGHGTHVTGSVLGNGCRSGSSGLPGYSGSYAGLAPQASLVFQSIMDSSCGLGGLPDDLNDLFSQARTAGARIHTNSWGAAVAGQYTVDSQNTDLFMWNNKDYTILFAAGNEGTDSGTRDGYIDADSMSAPGTAKNCITVGASENYRLTGGYNPGGPCSTWGGCWPTDYGTEPIYSDRLSNNIAGMVAFSSRGPTDDGRLKPDVVAPGSNILSTKSQALYVSGGWGAGPNQYYQYMGGTSMATPLTAGAIALIRDWYTDVKLVTPSAALLKATVINSAVNLHPGQYTSPLEQQPPLPNSAQGWGRVNVANATDDSHLFQDIADASGLQTGGSHPYNYQLCTAPVFKVTLVWTDYPGSTLVNDLDLVVTAPGGAVYRGNVFTNGWSTSGGSADRRNNVESVYIQAPAAGTWTVAVSGYNVPQGPRQGYALVVDVPSNICDPDFTLSATPASQDVCVASDAVYDVAVGQNAGFSSPVTLSTSGRPANTNESWSANPVTPPGNAVLTIGTTASTAAGSYTIDVVGTSGALSHSDTVTLNVFDATPGAPVLAGPQDGSTGVATTPTFTWNDVGNETSYTLDVATDPAFASVVHSASIPANSTSYNDAILGNDTVYYWRLRAGNACGNASSATWAFRTVVAPACGPAVLQDPSFEDGTPNSYWAETSTSFGTPLCTNGTCGGPPPSASDGSWWGWFGGVDGEELASLEQVITLPTGATTIALTFDFQAAVCNGKNDYFRIRVGSTQVFDVMRGNALCGATSYSHQSVNLTSFSGNQTLHIEGYSLANHSGWSNFHIDNLALEYTCPPAPPTLADYSDLSASNGIAWHTGDGSLRLGPLWDADTEFGVGTDDASDDGITLEPSTPWTPGATVTAYAVVGGSGGYLAGWFDWNDDGDFLDAGEKVVGRPVVNGTNSLSFQVGAGYVEGNQVNGRFRLYVSEPGVLGSETPDGATSGGEVEDRRFDPPVPTAVRLISFAAASNPGGALVTWETATERDNVGFHLYRSASIDELGDRLNAELIPSQSPGGNQGASYEFLDETALPGMSYYYTLEDVDANGGITRHGPVALLLWRACLPIVWR